MDYHDDILVQDMRGSVDLNFIRKAYYLHKLKIVAEAVDRALEFYSRGSAIFSRCGPWSECVANIEELLRTYMQRIRSSRATFEDAGGMGQIHADLAGIESEGWWLPILSGWPGHATMVVLELVKLGDDVGSGGRRVIEG